jgi:hypothetical protein
VHRVRRAVDVFCDEYFGGMRPRFSSRRAHDRAACAHQLAPERIATRRAYGATDVVLAG